MRPNGDDKFERGLRMEETPNEPGMDGLRHALLGGVAGCCLVATVDHPGVTLPLPGGAFFCAGALAIAVGAAALVLPMPRRRFQTVAVAFALLLWLCLSYPFSIYEFVSRQSLAGWVGGVAIMTAIALSVRHRREWRMTAHALVAGATLLCLYGFELWLAEMDTHATTALMHATFSNSDCFAVIPLSALFLCSGLLTSSGRFAQVILCGESLILSSSIVASGSRAALLGGSVAMVVFLATILTRRRWSSVKAVLLALLPAAAVLPLLLFGGLMMPTWGRFEGLLQGEDEQGIAMREDVLVSGLRTAVQHPLLGSGPGTFDLAYQRNRPIGSLLPSYIYVNRAHDDFVEMAVEGGLPAFGLWIALLGMAVFRGNRFAVKGAMSPEAASAAAAVAGIAAYSTLNFAIALPADLFYWFACLGLAISIPARNDVLEPDRPAGIGPAAVLVVGGLMTLFFGWNVHRVNVLLTRADRYEKELRWEQSLALLTRASEIEGSRAELFARKARVEQRLGVLGSDRSLSTRASQDLQAAITLNPRSQEFLLAQADSLKRIGDYAGSENSLETAALYAPYRDEILQSLLLLHMLQNKPVESLETLKTWASRDATQRKNLGNLLQVVEKLTPGKGGDALERWARGEPADKTLALEVGRVAVDRLLAQRATSSAISLLKSLDRIDPKDSGILLCRAQAELQLGHTAVALSMLETLLHRNSEESYADYQRALEIWAPLMRARGATTAVAIRLSEHLTRNPAHAGVRLALADTYLALHQAEQARVLLDEGLQADPDNAQFLSRRGQLYQLDGSGDMAAQYFRRALQRDPRNPEAIQGLKALGQL